MRCLSAEGRACFENPSSAWCPHPRLLDRFISRVALPSKPTPSLPPFLSLCVCAQVTEGSYDFEANKMLLKLYLLYPTLANQEKVEKVRKADREMDTERTASPNPHACFFHRGLPPKHRSCSRRS